MSVWEGFCRLSATQRCLYKNGLPTDLKVLIGLKSAGRPERLILPQHRVRRTWCRVMPSHEDVLTENNDDTCVKQHYSFWSFWVPEISESYWRLVGSMSSHPGSSPTEKSRCQVMTKAITGDSFFLACKTSNRNSTHDAAETSQVLSDDQLDWIALNVIL